MGYPSHCPIFGIETMKTWFKKPDKITAIIVAASFAFLPIFGVLCWGLGIIFTDTGSVPVGFYRIVPLGTIQRGDFIAFCLPDSMARLGLRRGYLKTGFCAGGSDALIKQVIAIPGDHLEVSDEAIRVFHQGFSWFYGAPTRIFDHQHLPVHRFIVSGTVIARGYWVYGAGNPVYSWDSRYYGEISRANIQHRLVPLWQF